MTPIRIVIADDHPIFREGLRKVITRDPGLDVVGEAEDGRTAIDQVLTLRPDVAVLDLSMPVADGLAVVRAIGDAHLPTRTILLTMHDEVSLFESALDLGVAGYVLKDGAVTEIASAIHAVARGGHFISPALSTHLLSRRSAAKSLAANKPSLLELTPMERRVLALIANEKTSKEIAAALFISVRTVEHHRAHICERLSLHGANALVRFAIANRHAICSMQT